MPAMSPIVESLRDQRVRCPARGRSGPGTDRWARRRRGGGAVPPSACRAPRRRARPCPAITGLQGGGDGGHVLLDEVSTGADGDGLVDIGPSPRTWSGTGCARRGRTPGCAGPCPIRSRRASGYRAAARPAGGAGRIDSVPRRRFRCSPSRAPRPPPVAARMVASDWQTMGSSSTMAVFMRVLPRRSMVFWESMRRRAIRR